VLFQFCNQKLDRVAARPLCRFLVFRGHKEQRARGEIVSGFLSFDKDAGSPSAIVRAPAGTNSCMKGYRCNEYEEAQAAEGHSRAGCRAHSERAADLDREHPHRRVPVRPMWHRASACRRGANSRTADPVQGMRQLQRHREVSRPLRPLPDSGTSADACHCISVTRAIHYAPREWTMGVPFSGPYRRPLRCGLTSPRGQ